MTHALKRHAMMAGAIGCAITARAETARFVFDGAGETD